MKYIALLTLFVSGCIELNCGYEPDKEERKKFFFQCLSSLPKGPEITEYNDWDEVVNECGNQANYSVKKVKVCY